MKSNDIVANNLIPDIFVLSAQSEKKTCGNIGNSCHPLLIPAVHMKWVANRKVVSTIPSPSENLPRKCLGKKATEENSSTIGPIKQLITKIKNGFSNKAPWILASFCPLQWQAQTLWFNQSWKAGCRQWTEENEDHVQRNVLKIPSSWSESRLTAPFNSSR